MAIGPSLKRVLSTIFKYRYGVLILSAGIAMLLLPGKKETKVHIEDTTEKNQTSIIESRLSELLSSVDGAGKTEVLLTIMAGEQYIYQVDQESSVDETSDETNITTIIVRNGDKEENGLIRQVIPPSYLGAIVVCQGGDNTTVKLAIVDAVSKATGLGADKISVLTMK